MPLLALEVLRGFTVVFSKTPAPECEAAMIRPRPPIRPQGASFSHVCLHRGLGHASTRQSMQQGHNLSFMHFVAESFGMAAHCNLCIASAALGRWKQCCYVLSVVLQKHDTPVCVNQLG